MRIRLKGTPSNQSMMGIGHLLEIEVIKIGEKKLGLSDDISRPDRADIPIATKECALLSL
jgi:hypothetical protein